MFEIGPKELEQAREFIKEGKYKETFQILKDFEERENNSLQDIVLCHLVKCNLFLSQGFFRKTVNLADQTYRESLELGKHIMTVDALLLKANALLNGWGKIEDTNKIIKQVEELLKTIKEIPVVSKNQREGLIIYLKGMTFDPSLVPLGNIDLALKYYKQSLGLFESLGAKFDIGLCLLRISNLTGIQMGNIDLALDYVEKALNIFKEINHKFFISWSLTIKATLYSEKGEVARSIPIFQQSLTIVKELKHKLLTSGILNNMADTYRMNGELEKALECSKSSLEIFSQFGNTKPLANYHDFLIQILIEMGDIKQARYYFNQLEQLNNQLKDRTINEIYILNKASMLKESPRISDKGKAQESLKQLLEDGDLSLEGKKRVLIKLCELLLSELQMTGDLEVLKEVESFITQLLAIAEKSRSYWIWGETFLLQAKLALTSLNLKQARRLLTQGQKIAEKYGLNLLAKKISNEHDELLKKLKIWENLKVSDSPLDARVRLSGLNEQIEKMIQKRVINVPDLSDEVPVLLFIVSEGGTPFFSQSFEEDKNFEDHLFGGFLSAINSFMDEMFSEGLDRASFGDYTLLMNSISPFFMCYIFKGQSYTAHQRLLYFIDKLRSDKEVWQSLELYHLKNQEIQLQDIPSLETLIKDVFIEKKIVENW